MGTSKAKSYHAVPGATSVLLALTVAVTIGAPCVGAHAQTAGGETEQPPGDSEQAGVAEAARLFEEAERAYNDGELTHAVELLERAHATYPEPVLLYNLARAHEDLGHFEQAVSYYEQYLEQQPDTRDRGAIERRLGTLRDQIALEERGGTEEQPTAAATPPADGPSPLPPWIVGAGAAALAGGVVVGLVASSRRSDAEDAPSHRAGDEALEDARTYATIANVLFVAGGVVAAVGLTWWIVDVSGSDGEATDRAAIGIGPGNLAMRLRW